MLGTWTLWGSATELLAALEVLFWLWYGFGDRKFIAEAKAQLHCIAAVKTQLP